MGNMEIVSSTLLLDTAKNNLFLRIKSSQRSLAVSKLKILNALKCCINILNINILMYDIYLEKKRRHYPNNEELFHLSLDCLMYKFSS